MTHSDSDFLAMYHERRTDQEHAVEHAIPPRKARTKVRRHSIHKHVVATVGFALTLTGRALERLGEHLIKIEEHSPRACT